MPDATRKTVAANRLTLFATSNPDRRAELEVLNVPGEIGRAGASTDTEEHSSANPGAIGGDRMSQMPPRSNGSLRSGGSKSHSSHSSRSARRRQLEAEELLAAMRETQRQADVELQKQQADAEVQRQQVELQKKQLDNDALKKKLEDDARLVQLRLQVEDEEENEDDRRSIVLSVPPRAPDVDDWAKQQAAATRQLHVDSPPQVNLPPPAFLVNAPNQPFVSRRQQTQLGRNTQHERSREDFHSFPRMTNGVTSGINHTAPRDDNLKHFVARQTVAKDLPDFFGNPEEWPKFYSRLKRTTKICGFTEEDNIYRLDKCLKGKAKESVSCMLSAGSGLEDILNVLQKRFGRSDQIIKKMLEKARAAPPPVEGDFQSILDFSIAMKNLCVTAESLSLPVYVNNPVLVEEFVRKLPSHLQLEWGRHIVRTRQEDLTSLSEFLDEVSSAAVHVCLDPVVQPTKKKNRDQCLVVTNLTCPLKCKESHTLNLCPKFKRMNTDDRWECVKKIRVCFCCLKTGHSVPKCSSNALCGKDGCGRRHHSLLHNPEFRRDFAKDGAAIRPADGNPLVVVSQPRYSPEKILMKIIPVQLSGPKGSTVVNAFLDDGSSITMIDETVAEALGLDGESTSLHLNWLGGRSEHDSQSKLVSLKVRGIAEEKEFNLDNVRTKRELNLPVVPLSSYKSVKKWKHLEEVPFPSPLPDRPSMIIGSDNSHLLLPRKSSEGPKSAPIATWTYLGWALHGPHGRPSGLRESHTAMINIEGEDPDQVLHEMVKEQFRLEALGVVNCPKLPQSKQNERADFIMETTSRRVEDGWETRMLWKKDDLTLPESRWSAERRLKLVEKKIDADEELANQYCAKFQEYETKKFCHKLSDEEAAVDNGRVWYLPHFGRINPNKPGKLRLVFDCAAKVNGTSLNDALLQGPDLMSPLINVLLKFRQREIAFSGDIRDMFHMVEICQEDVPALRFLWRGKDRSRPPDVYSMDVMIFGAVSSPYQAQWIKNRNASEFVEEFPEAVDAIHNRHYVDDYLDSCTTTEEAIKKIMEVREIHRRGGFEIRGWLCNDEDVLKVVAPGEVQQKEILPLEVDKLERVLGLYWDPKSDTFKFQCKFRMIDPKIVCGEKTPTKRELLRLIMSLFDPLGFITHLTVRGRMLLQEVWKSAIGWDECLKPQQEEKWKLLLHQIMKIPEVVIRRCLAPNISSCEDIQLHVFCDASQQAFCAVAYLRVVQATGEVSLNIVKAKSRVAPIKCTSIPRLEMEAALIGVRMSNHIKSNLDLKISSTYLWTDSKNVLCWIRAEDPGKFKMYISHRIGEILDLSEVENWRWVPTAQNVADDATSDSSPANLSPSARWFTGPDFLKETESAWPKENVKVQDVSIEDLEMKKVCMVVTEVPPLLSVNNYSSWNRLIRVTAWIQRFKRNASTAGKKICKSYLTVPEIKDAVNHWIKHSQSKCFPEELDCLLRGKPVARSSRLFRLSPTIVDGIIVVRSRLANAHHLSPDVKHPIILDPKDEWTRLLVAWYHQMYGHHGVDLICNELKQKYWILGTRAAVKKAARECPQCRLENAKLIVPEMAPLPEVRVIRPERPFTYVGVDYFGPMEVVNGRKREKRYGVLFTCLSTRAIHLEMSFSLSTDDFLMALNRFICRRGEPEEIWSDNGTNFVGADREMKKAIREMDESEIGDQLTTRGIKWNFNPPGAPHMGGAWERLVRSVKTAMHTILKNRTMNDQLLSTVLAEAEASVNSRPLTTVSNDLDDMEAITPNCFLMGTTSIKQRPEVFEDGDLFLRKRWRHAQVLANHFWRRWVKEYLPSLSLRSKWNKDVPDVTVGEIVFVADLNEIRNNWIKGRVEAVYPGKDGRVRVVDVKTASGIIRRPVAKLYRIEGWKSSGDSTQ